MKSFSVKNFEKFQHYKDRAPPWIKLYNGLLEDYEFGGLPDASKMHLIAIWLLASRSDNKIPYDPKWVSGRINATEPVDLELLAARGFIVLDQGVHQSASKSPAECLSREEGQVQDIEKSKEETPTVASLPRDREAFQKFKAAYPRRDGANPWLPAEKKFSALVKSGLDPEVLIRAAGELAREEGTRGNIGTKFIPQAITWLNQQRFADCAAQAFVAGEDPPGFYAKADSEQLEAWDQHARSSKGKGLPRDRNGGWRVAAEWPPGYVPGSRSHDPPAIPALRAMQ